jgi:hypothetical protein
MIQGDSVEYNLLAKWSNFDCDGHHSCEIGVRDGMGSKIIMDNIKNNYIHTGVDPYGDRVYQHIDNQENCQWDGLEKGVAPTYSDTIRDTMLNDLKEYRNAGKFNLANMTDTFFMSDPYYKDTKYAFVHFDGPHMTRDVLTEAVWFANRAAPHTRFVFDDYPKYDMQLISDVLKPFGFTVLEQGKNKICLQKNQ